VPLIALVAAVAVWEAARLWRSRARDRSLLQLATSPVYRLSSAALLIGICGGALYGIKGAWAYTNFLRALVEALHRHAMGPGLFQFLLFGALVGGMVLSAVLRRSFRLRNVAPIVRARRLAGGALMGLGAGAIPGGNDALLLTGLPTLSLWATGVYLMLLAGVACTLIVLRRTSVGVARVECTGDLCHEAAIA
jgi:hypothetical protein